MENEEKLSRPSFKERFNLIFIFIVILLLLLPVFTTFNEFLSEVVLKSGFWKNFQDAWVPYLARFVGGFVGMFGIETSSQGSVLMIHKGADVIPFFISWNCIGWQSLILIILTLITGLQGAYSFGSKTETIVIGLLGTFIMNVIRISIIAMLVYWWGNQPAAIFHNYGSTAITIAWIIIFWWFAFSYVLKPEKKDEEKEPTDENEV